MSNPKGIITRKDIIEDQALNWGDVYSENIKEAVKQNNILVDSVKTLNKTVLAFKVANSQKDYITAKQAETLATQQAIEAIKKQEIAEISADKIKRSSIATMEAERKAKQAVTDAEYKSQKSKESSVKLTIEERVQNEINNKTLKQAALENLGLVSVYTKLNNSRAQAKNKLRDLIASETASTAEIKKAQKEYDNLDVKVRKADQAVGDFTKNVGNYPKLNQFTGGLKNLVGAFGLVGGVAAFASVVKNAVKIVIDYEREIVNLAAIAGKTRKEIAPLENQIRSVSATSINGATDVAKLATELVKLGSSPEEAAKLLKPIDDLSVALKASAEDSATLVKSLLNAYGEGADEAVRFTDVLAASANKSALDFQGLRDAFSYLAPTAKALGLNIEQTSAIISTLADNGIKAESAGRLMSTSFIKLSTAGLTLDQALDQINKKQAEGASKLDILRTAGNLFGAESAKLGLILADNRDKTAGLTKEYQNAAGSLKDLVGKQLESTGAKLKILDSAWEDLVLSIEDGNGAISGFFNFFIVGITASISGLSRFNTSWDELFSRARLDGQAEGVEEFNRQFRGIFTEGISDVKEVAQGIKDRASKLYKLYENELIQNEKKLKEKEKSLKSGLKIKDLFEDTPVDLKKIKEDLNKKLSLQAAIIREAGKKQRGQKDPTVQINSTPLSEEELKKIKDSDAKRLKDKLELEKKLSDSLYQLLKQRLEQTIKFNDEIVSDELQSDDIRIQALSNSQQKQRELLLLTKNYLLKEDNLTANDRIRIDEDYSNKLIDLNLKTQKQIDKINEFDLAKYQAEIDAKVKAEETISNNKIAEEDNRFASELANLGNNQKLIEEATQKHEENLFTIKKNAALAIAKIQLDNLQIELDAFKAQTDGSDKSNKIILELENKLSEARKALAEAGLDTFKKNEEGKTASVKEQTIKILETSQQLTSGLADLANAFSSGKIQKIDEEIAKNDEYYANEIAKAGDDQRKKDTIQKEAEIKRKKLEEEKRKEQTKQARFNKIINIAEVSMATALAVIRALSAPPGLPFTAPAGILAGILGGLQLAAVIATPIPKYKDGRKGGVAEIAWVGDGGKHEIIERASGLIQMTPATDTLVKLEQGDKVHSSTEEYFRLQKASFLTSTDIQGRKVSDFQANQYFENNNKDLLIEMKLTRKAIEKNKPNIVLSTPKFDINHHLWKMKNTNWN